MNKLRRFGDDAIGRDGGDLVRGEFREEKVVAVPRPNVCRRTRDGEGRGGKRGRVNPGNLGQERACDPEIAIRSRGDGAWCTEASEFGNHAIRA